MTSESKSMTSTSAQYILNTIFIYNTYKDGLIVSFQVTGCVTSIAP